MVWLNASSFHRCALDGRTHREARPEAGVSHSGFCLRSAVKLTKKFQFHGNSEHVNPDMSNPSILYPEVMRHVIGGLDSPFNCPPRIEGTPMWMTQLSTSSKES